MMDQNTPLLEVKNLKKYFTVGQGGELHAVDDVSFQIKKGTTLGIVGESGCGKSTLGRVILHLLPNTGGQILFEGRDITHPSRSELKKLRADMQMIFQDPFSSLNPRQTVAEAIKEPLQLIKGFKGAELDKEIRRVMDVVGLPERLANSYPHELDGGRRQRIGIGRALSVNPKFIVCDEPVSALDVSIQAQVLNLMLDLQEEFGLTYIFVTHDMSVVKYISDDICVMYLGQVVEKCSSDELFANPLHPYTKALLSAIPTLDIYEKENRIALEGELTSPINPKPGCRFAARCHYATEACQQPQTFEELLPNHFVLCHKAGNTK